MLLVLAGSRILRKSIFVLSMTYTITSRLHDQDSMHVATHSHDSMNLVDDADANCRYSPFLLEGDIMKTDWVSQLELNTVKKLALDDLSRTGKPLKILILYGSLSKRYE